MGPINEMPLEVMANIFSYLNHQEKIQITSRINHTWKTVSDRDQIIRSLFPNLTFPAEGSALDYIMMYGVKSLDELIDRINDFFSRVKFKQIAVFECVFPLENSHKITVALLGYGREEKFNCLTPPLYDEFKLPSDIDLKEIYIFTQRLQQNFNDCSSNMSCKDKKAFHIMLPSIGREKMKALGKKIETILTKQIDKLKCEREIRRFEHPS